MTRLGELDKIIQNAVNVIKRANGNRWRVFQTVNGKLTAPEIGKLLGIDKTNVAHDLTLMVNKGLLEIPKKKGRAPVYAKIPELRNTNLRPYFTKNTKTMTIRQSPTMPTESAPKRAMQLGIKSKSIAKVIDIGTRYDVKNIDQNWVDALVILNFIETACTKFLMDHGFSEDDATDIKWEQKILAVQNKLFEEAKAKGTKPRSAALTVLTNYRVQRNIIDHQAHVSTASVEPEEVTLLIQILRVFVKEVFDRHKSYCGLQK